MFKEKKMRQIVEAHLHQVETLLQHAKQHELYEVEQSYIVQKLTLEYVLRDFDNLNKKY